MSADIEAFMARLNAARANPKTAEEVRQWEWNHEVLPRLREVQLPPRFHYEMTDWNCEPQQKTFEYCRRTFTGRGAIIALVGSRGTGKTSIAAQLIVERAKGFFDAPTRWPVPYTKLTDLIAMFKPLYADFGSIATEPLTRSRNQFCKYPLRIIDELHDCDDQRMKSRILTDIIDRCYSGMVDTLLISNEKEEDFRKSVGDSVVSRINEHGRIIECTWPSHRVRNHQS